MAKLKVVHPIRHDGKPYGRGSVVDVSPKDAKRLQQLGHVELASGEADSAAAANLEQMTKAQLADFALATYNLTLDVTLAKAGLIEAINQAAAAPISDQV